MNALQIVTLLGILTVLGVLFAFVVLAASDGVHEWMDRRAAEKRHAEYMRRKGL